MYYNQSSFFNKMFTDQRLLCKQIPCGSQRVSNALESEIPLWKDYPIIINAPTGAGKSTFVFHELADYAKKNRKTILVLSNRISLLKQQKQVLWQKLNSTIIGSNVLDDYYVYDNILLSTYQGIMGLV